MGPKPPQIPPPPIGYANRSQHTSTIAAGELYQTKASPVLPIQLPTDRRDHMDGPDTGYGEQRAVDESAMVPMNVVREAYARWWFSVEEVIGKFTQTPEFVVSEDLGDFAEALNTVFTFGPNPRSFPEHPWPFDPYKEAT